MSDTETTAKAKALTLHRLCLIVPLAIQLSLPVILAGIPICEALRHEYGLQLQGWQAVFYFLLVTVAFFWLPIYVACKRKKLGNSAKAWIICTVVLSFLSFLLLFILSLPQL